MEVAQAYTLISHAIDTGHAANGYLVVGGVKGNCMELTRLVLHKLFPDYPQQIDAGSHPDVITLEPEGKARIIPVDSMRERLVDPMNETAFSGGWKVGVIVGADRMRKESANAFLKSLEEPPPKTLYLLLTDQPDSMFPTIVSRTQRINLPIPSGILEGEDYDAVAQAFSAHDVTALVEKFAELKGAVEDEDVALVRKSFFKTLMRFVRMMMISGKLPAYQAYRNVEAVESAYRRSENHMTDETVLAALLDAVVFPK